MTEPDHLERAVSILAFIAIRLLQLRESFTLPLLLKAYDLHEEAKRVAAQSCEHVLTNEEWTMLLLSEKKKNRNWIKRLPFDGLIPKLPQDTRLQRENKRI